jgi:hypothetical protein
MTIIGDKECQLVLFRMREKALLDTVDLQKRKIAELETATAEKKETN